MSVATVFVTVGTTKFDGLAQAVLQPQVQNALKEKGYERILLQYGKSNVEWPSEKDLVLPTDSYDFKPSVLSDVASASLVISHAGAGSCLEALEANKPLIVVVNDTLMHNHQTELAKKLADDGHCVYCESAAGLAEAIATFDSEGLRVFPRGNKEAFARHIDSLMGGV